VRVSYGLTRKPGNLPGKCGDPGNVSSNFAKASAEKLMRVTLRGKISKLRPIGERNPQQGNRFVGLAQVSDGTGHFDLFLRKFEGLYVVSRCKSIPEIFRFVVPIYSTQALIF
jgi:hypothetical protein